MPAGEHHDAAPGPRRYQALPITSNRPSGSISSTDPQQPPRSGTPPGNGGNAIAPQLAPPSVDSVSGYGLEASRAAIPPPARPINSELVQALKRFGQPGADHEPPPLPGTP